MSLLMIANLLINFKINIFSLHIFTTQSIVTYYYNRFFVIIKHNYKIITKSRKVSMLSNQEYISSQHWLVFSEHDNPEKGDPNSALSYQDSFIRWVPALNDDASTPYGVVHFYPFDYPAILLGAKDTRLPELGNANNYLVDLGYTLVQRPHGGLAVVNDPGVINFGLVSDNRHFDLSIDHAYEQMV